VAFMCRHFGVLILCLNALERVDFLTVKSPPLFPLQRVSRYPYEGRKSAQIGVFLVVMGGQITNVKLPPHDEYMDDESGTKGKRERSGFARLFEDAGKRKFDVVLVWSLDRFTREGISKTIFYLQQLDGLGVNFKSYTEQYLDVFKSMFI